MNSVPMGITHKEGALTFPELTAINGTLFSNPDFIKNDDPWPTLDFPKLEYVYSISFGSSWGNTLGIIGPSLVVLMPSLKALGGPAAVASHGNQGSGMALPRDALCEFPHQLLDAARNHVAQ